MNDSSTQSSGRAATVEELVSIKGPVGSIEAVLEYRPELVAREAALVLSPHPGLGGDMANNVTGELARGLASRGLPALRFNYRGIGASGGPFEGPLESFRYWSELQDGEACEGAFEDSGAALAWLRRLAPRVHLVGYSFGAILAWRLAAGASIDIASVVLVAPPVGAFDLESLGSISASVLAIHGTDDFATSIESVEEALCLVPDSSFVRLDETDHFFRGREPELASRVGEFLDARGAIPETVKEKP